MIVITEIAYVVQVYKTIFGKYLNKNLTKFRHSTLKCLVIVLSKHSKYLQ